MSWTRNFGGCSLISPRRNRDRADHRRGTVTMIYITGDTHGGFQRFNTRNFPQQKQMNRSDYAVVTGDFGGVWDDSPKETYWLDWLEEKSTMSGPMCFT